MRAYRSVPRPTRFFVSASLLVATLAAQQPAPPGAPLVRDVRGTAREAGEGKVRVTLWHNDLERVSVDAVGEALAAADGSFAFAGVPWFEKQQWGHHSYVVIARTDRRVGAMTVRGDGVDPGSLAIVLGEAVEVRGVLRGQDDGLPIAGAQVWARILGDFQKGGCVWLGAPLPPWTAVSDAEGRFTLKGLPALRPLHLMAGGDEHATTPIQVPDPAQPVEAALARGGKVSGVVLLPDGKPAVRVRVRTSGEMGGYAQTLTGDDGTFCLTGLTATTYKVWAEAPDLTVIAVLGLRVEPGVAIENQKVQLVRGGFIVGRIVDHATGAPIAGGPHTDVAMYGPARGSGGACEATPVLADGTFRIRAPAGGNRIYLRGAEGWSEPSEVVEVVEGQETKVEWRLRKTGAGRREDR